MMTNAKWNTGRFHTHAKKFESEKNLKKIGKKRKWSASQEEKVTHVKGETEARGFF